MATFLKICQDTAREAGIPGLGPDTVVNQTGQTGDVVRWVRNSYEEIQNRNGGFWRWLRHEFTIDTVVSQDTYAPSSAIDKTTGNAIDRFSAWKINNKIKPPTISLKSSQTTANPSGNEVWMTYVGWESFGQIYRISQQIDAFPIHIAIDPQDNIVVGPKPVDIYVVDGDYYRSPQILTLDEDVPEMPKQYHNLIMWYALEHYGYKNLATEAIARAEKKSKNYMRQLQSNQGARWYSAGPLV